LKKNFGEKKGLSFLFSFLFFCYFSVQKAASFKGNWGFTRGKLVRCKIYSFFTVIYFSFFLTHCSSLFFWSHFQLYRSLLIQLFKWKAKLIFTTFLLFSNFYNLLLHFKLAFPILKPFYRGTLFFACNFKWSFRQFIF
jgi:hypothetical protein